MITNRIFRVGCALWLLSIGAQARQTSLGLEWVRNDGPGGNGHWYAYDPTHRSWSVAERYANEFGGYLARVRTQQEQDFIHQQVTSSSAWVGATNVGTGSLWHYPDGDMVSYTNWCDGEPNNSGGSEHYALMNWHGDGCWNDATNSPTDGAVFEIDPTWRRDEGAGPWYRLTQRADNWTRQRTLALAMGADLASLHSSDATEFLMDELIPLVPPDSFQDCSDCRLAWIGLTDELQEGQFVWSDGSDLDYLDWASGQPQGSHHSEDYVAMNWDGAGRWADVRGNPTIHAILETESGDCNANEIPDVYEFFLGIAQDSNGNGVPDDCEIDAETYGFCPAGSSACAWDAPTSGCTNSTGLGGLLGFSGTSRVSLDDLVLSATNLPINQFGLFYMGGGAASAPFGNGLRCVSSGGVGIYRFPVVAALAGTMQLGPGIVAFSQAHFPLSGQIQSGSTWYFQGWYRDPSGLCGVGAGHGFNLTNGVRVSFLP